MLPIFRTITDRLKAMFLADVGLDFEAHLLERAAERKAELLRRAARYEKEKLHGIAQHLRRQADGLSLDRPLASVLPAIRDLTEPAIPVTVLPAAGPRALPLTAKKKGKL